MRSICFIIFTLAFACSAVSQDVPARIKKAFATFLSDPQLAHASASLYVVDGKSGNIVFDYNSSVGLAPASTLKVVTSITAFEKLGPGFRFRTAFDYTGRVSSGKLTGDVIIRGSGDPTLGSWRYNSSNEASVTDAVINALKKSGVREISGIVYGDDHLFSSATVPGGWIWDDIGNYYGADASALNWRENQYDIFFKPSATNGGQPSIIKTVPALYQVQLVNELTTGAKGSGDNSNIYISPYSSIGYIRGSIPMENNFKVSGSFPDPALQTAALFTEALKSAGYNPGIPETYHGWSGDKNKSAAAATNFYTHYSPPIDSIIYWFNKKSVNLYGEALVKKIASEATGSGSTEDGVKIIRDFWSTKGIDATELDMTDGSGLSPQDRITTHAQVQILQYASSRPWFNQFLGSLPEYNGMTMKSGTIRKVKGFCGYHRSASGKSYTFSFLVNNYSGTASSLVSKMYAVLDQLK